MDVLLISGPYTYEQLVHSVQVGLVAHALGWHVLVNTCTFLRFSQHKVLRGVWETYRLDKTCSSRGTQALEDHVQDRPQYGNSPAPQLLSSLPWYTKSGVE